MQSYSFLDDFVKKYQSNDSCYQYNVIMDLFDTFFIQAKANKNINDATAFCLATSDKNSIPDARILLLKKADERGFVFFTNKNSKKGRDISQNPIASMCFYWDEIGVQIRVLGSVSEVLSDESDEYYNSRSQESQVGAVVSKQSSYLESRDKFCKEYEDYNSKILSGEVKLKRPPNWGGYLVQPTKIEFWNDRPFRLHDRTLFIKQTDGLWKICKLYP